MKNIDNLIDEGFFDFLKRPNLDELKKDLTYVLKILKNELSSIKKEPSINRTLSKTKIHLKKAINNVEILLAFYKNKKTSRKGT